MREHGKLQFKPVPWLLEMAFQDRAFPHFNSLETLENWNSDNNEPISLLWRPSVATEPMLRQVTRFGGLSNSAWTRECFCRLFRAFVATWLFNGAATFMEVVPEKLEGKHRRILQQIGQSKKQSYVCTSARRVRAASVLLVGADWLSNILRQDTFRL